MYIYIYVYTYTEWTYIDTRESGGLRHGDVSAPAARRMVRTLLWPPLPHRTLANIGPLCPSRPLPLCLVACPLSLYCYPLFSPSPSFSLVDSLFLHHSVSLGLSVLLSIREHISMCCVVARIPQCLVIFEGNKRRSEKRPRAPVDTRAICFLLPSSRFAESTDDL